MYTSYVTPEEYANLGYNAICAKELPKYLRDASRQIDRLTFNRIIALGFENLSEFQKEIIQEVVCEHANFLEENEDELATILNKWSVSGLSIDFENAVNIRRQQDVAIQNSLYSLLIQTGLCCRVL